MREEIAAAVVFVKRLVQKNESLSKDKVDEFSSCLSSILINRFRNHWYDDKPFKGQGYRCIRINPCEPKDEVLDQAAKECGLQFWDLNMPSEMTLWVDPREVYCRFGETTGACCLVASFKDGQVDNKAHTIDLEDLVERSKQQNIQFMNSRNFYANTNNNFNQTIHNKPHHPNGTYDNQTFTLFNDQVHWQRPGSYSHRNKNLNAATRKNFMTKKGSKSSEASQSSSNDRFHWACKKSNITVSQA